MRGKVGVGLMEEKGRLVMQKDVKRLEYVALVHTSMHRSSLRRFASLNMRYGREVGSHIQG
jgi:hypothetical protein